MFLFVSRRNLLAPSADRRETLPHTRKLVVLYNASPIGLIWGPYQKWGQKQCKILVDFVQLQILITNISGKTQDMQNRKSNVSATIPLAFYEKGEVNFGPLITEI